MLNTNVINAVKANLTLRFASIEKTKRNQIIEKIINNVEIFVNKDGSLDYSEIFGMFNFLLND